MKILRSLSILDSIPGSSQTIRRGTAIIIKEKTGSVVLDIPRNSPKT
jgi:hypothetical protein